MTRNARIAMAADAYMPWSGGSRVYYHNLYSRLAADLGHEVNVLTTHTARDQEFDKIYGCASMRIHRSGYPLPDWKLKRLPACATYTARLAVTLAKLRPDVLHCGDLAPQSLAAYSLHRLTGRPYLVFVHGDEISQTDRRRYQPHLRNAIYRHASVLVAANPFALDHLNRILGPNDKCHLILPGVDFARFFESDHPSEVRESLLRGSSGPLLFTAARLVRRKGHAALLRALPRLIAQYPHLHYAIAGDGPERQSLASLTDKLGVAHHVSFLGDISHDKLGDYYRASDIFVLPNQEDPGGDIESFGMVFIEANACGRPVVGGLAGGTSAAVINGYTGLLCDASNSGELGETVLRLMRNPTLAEAMGRAGAARARKDFRWSARAEALHEITQNMAAVETPRVGNARALSSDA